MTILKEGIWNLLNYMSNRRVFDNRRFDIHKNRLNLLVKSYLGSKMESVYFLDWNHSLQTESKWDFSIPVFCKKTHIKNFYKTFLFFSLIRTERNFSFSDFIFKAIKKKTTVEFMKSNDDRFTSIKVIKRPYLDKIIISFSKTNFYQVDLSNIEVNYADKFHNVTDEWQYFDLRAIKSIAESDFKLKEIAESMKKHFQSIKGNNDGSMKDVLKIINLETKSSIAYDYFIGVVEVMYTALAFLPEISGYIYIPSIVSLEEENEQSSGGFVIANFDDSSLSEDDEEIMYLIAKNWFSENAIADFSAFVKDAEWKNLFRKLWHNTQFHVAGAMDLAFKLETRLKELAPSESFPKLTEYLHDLRYILELSRYVDNPQDYVIARDTAQRIRWPKETNISKIVQEIIVFIKTDIQKDEGRVLRIETDNFYNALYQGVQQNTLFELCIDDSVCITSYPEVVAMIIKDILVNATSNAINFNTLQKGSLPKVTVKVAKEPNGNGVVFTVRNESGISNEAFSIWKEGKIPDASKLHNPLGILICRNYLNWLGYRFDIPEACIKENGGKFTEVSIHFLDEPLEFIKWKEQENVSKGARIVG